MEKQEHAALLYTIPFEKNKLFFYSVNCHTGEGPILHRRNPKQTPNRIFQVAQLV